MGFDLDVAGPTDQFVNALQLEVIDADALPGGSDFAVIEHYVEAFNSDRFGFGLATRILVPELLSTALMVYMFLREMPNSLLRRA